MGCVSAGLFALCPAVFAVKVAILFDFFGPYHVARLAAASHLCETLAIQVRRHSRDYAWEPCTVPPDCASVTLEAGAGSAGSRFGEWEQRLDRALSGFSPDCVFVPGWSSRYALAALSWGLRHRVPAVLMSESTAADLRRQPVKEWLKSRIVAAYSAALVGGSPQAEYVHRLGISDDRIFVGYNVVDNDYFKLRTDQVRRHSDKFRREFGLPDRYFLSSARFITSKNLAYLIQEYATYRALFRAPDKSTPKPSSRLPWSLVIIGDGTERRNLESLVSGLRLNDSVCMPGFKQYADLPIYYALAGAFVHASTSEPWGLVVNEAMACRLPVAVSERCGCVRDLVRIEQNGFTFDPTRRGQLSRLMLRMSSSRTEGERLGQAGAALISRWGPERFGRGFRNAANRAVDVGACARLGPHLFVQCLLHR